MAQIVVATYSQHFEAKFRELINNPDIGRSYYLRNGRPDDVIVNFYIGSFDKGKGAAIVFSTTFADYFKYERDHVDDLLLIKQELIKSNSRLDKANSRLLEVAAADKAELQKNEKVIKDLKAELQKNAKVVDMQYTKIEELISTNKGLNHANRRLQQELKSKGNIFPEMSLAAVQQVAAQPKGKKSN